jgi:hypothetical protein
VPKIVISQIQLLRLKTLPLIDNHNTIKTPYILKAIRQIKKSIKEEPTQKKIKKIFKAIDTL